MKRLNILFFFLAFVYCGIVYKLNPSEKIENYIEIYGTVIQILLPAYCAVPILGKKDYKGVFYFLIYFVSVLGVVYLLKYSIDERRPYGGHHSFPSGHTSAAFIGVLFLFRRYGNVYLLSTLPLGIYVAVSRVVSRNHWTIDVLAAILIAVVLGFLIVKPYKKT